jgi:hypothetical protein
MDKLEELNRLWRYRLWLADMLAETNKEMLDVIEELGEIEYCQACGVYYQGNHECQPEDKEG